MRPLELVVNGFRSYAEETRFDWRVRRLVGVVGPIGSGKSSILDAIAFALYGRTPSSGADTKGLIHQRQQVAQVQLTFRVDGQAWQVTRAIRSKGQGNHSLCKYDDERGEADTGAAITGQKAVTDRITALLGLDFDAFRRSVLLAQNRFAEFLNATAVERDRVLQGVFNLDRVGAMQVVAKDRLHEAVVDAADLAKQIEDVAAARVRVGERRTDRAGQQQRLATLEAQRPAIEEQVRIEGEARAQAALAQLRIAEIEALRAGLPRAEESNQTIDGFASLAQRTAEARSARETAEAGLAAASAARDAALEASGGAGRIEEASAALQAQEHARALRDDRARQHASAEAALAAAQAKATAAAAASKQRGAEAARAEQALASTQGAVTAADDAVHAAERLDYALALRDGVAAGDPCPVCGRKIAKLPPAEASPDLDRAHAERASAEAAHQRADTAARRARDAASAATATAAAVGQQAERDTATVTAAATALAEADAALDTAGARVRDLLGGGNPAAILAALKAALTEAEAAVRDADGALQSAHQAEARATDAQEAGGRALTSLRLRLATVAAKLGVAVPDDGAPAAVRALLDEVRARWVSERSAATETERAAIDGAEAAAGRLRAALAACGVPDGASFESAVAAVKQGIAVLDALIAEDERRVAEGADAEQRAAAIEARRAIYQRLSTDLVPSRFLNYLLEDERTSLAEIGSEWFERLSRGRYRFANDGSFDVTDLTAAEHPRRSETLSGGETFLASLSLALALAEMVTQGGGRLDAFFLDEGFGSLDEEHLDLAMEGIERLVTESDDRLVVIVSHVPALRERIEDLIVLDRDPATGDTVVRRGATAGAPQAMR
ncbi:MAG: SMC family ATPase [Dehalococcoidia bacterium]